MKEKENHLADASVMMATTDDIDDIASLFDQYRRFYGQVSDQAGAANYLRERTERRESVIFFIRLEKTRQVVAFTQLYPSFSSISMQSSWILNDLYVQEAFRGRGLAGRLMEAARVFAKSSGAKGLGLSTAKDNLIAQKLYESLQYKRDDIFYHYYLTI